MGHNLDRVKKMLRTGRAIGASVAPSYGCAFPGVSPGQIVASLEALGFSRVEETASVMPYVVRERLAQWESSKRPVISTSCPRVVSLVKLEFPHLAGDLFRLPSPMVLHTRDMHRRTPGGVVFIGPCTAKAGEADAHPGSADAVLTFDELAGWLEEAGLAFEEDGSNAGAGSTGSPLWAIASLLAADAAGLDACRRLFSSLPAACGDGAGGKPFIEALACEGGCLGGEGMSQAGTLGERRARVIEILAGAGAWSG